MKTITTLLILFLIIFSVKSQVIISELNDPQSNYQTNRWIEITNISTCDVDLSDYRVIAIGNSSNGSVASASGGSCTWNPTGTLAPGASVTFGGTANTAFTPTFTSAAFNNGTTINTNWNGQNRDGARLEKNGVLVDLAWISNSTGDFFENNSKIRNANVCQGDNNGNNASEWFNAGTTDHANAGTHTNTVSWCGASFTCPNPLPVELIEFKAIAKESIVEISWITITEQNNDYFTIEKSKDDIHFIPLVDVDGKGNTTTLSYYSEIDDRPYQGVSYYRLKQIDFDGTTTITDIVPVKFGESKSFEIYPNPATNYFFIHGKGIEKATISILNSIGQELKLLAQEEESIVKFDISDLKRGSYLIQIIHEDTIEVKKLIVQ